MTDTKTLIHALRILADEIESDDGVANAAIAEAAERLELLALGWTDDLPERDGWYWTQQSGRPSTRRVQWVKGGSDWTGYQFAGPILLPVEPHA